jgi:outer membrane protein TolC
MKAMLIFIICTLTVCCTVYSQTVIDSVISVIEKNNTALIAFRKQADAEILKSHTGIYLQNPQAGFNYLNGNPATIGNRTDISIMQSFDFPTAYMYRFKYADSRKAQAEAMYQAERKKLLLKVRLLCADIIYSNKLRNTYSKKLADAKKMSDLYAVKFSNGDVNSIENNKVQLNYISSKNEFNRIEIERLTQISELTALNGGAPIEIRDSVYPLKKLPEDFDQLYQNAEKANPELEFLKKESELNRINEKLNTALSLPKLTTGYMSEDNPGQKFQGISLGMTIPLWENKNTIRYAKANSRLSKSMEDDYQLQFRNKMRNLFEKAGFLMQSVDEFRNGLISVTSTQLLYIALDKGEISLMEFLLEQSLYYASYKEYLDTERELENTIIELRQYE